MHLTPEQEAKIDPLLLTILPDAEGDEILQVVMVLGEDEANTSTTKTLQPSQFSSRIEYRQALIEQRKQQLETGTVGQTVEALNNLSLTINGGKTSRFLVVEGTAKEIIKSLSLPGVKSATLDQIIRIEPIPIDPPKVEYLTNLILDIFPINKDKVSQAAKQYISNYYKNYGRLQVLGMRKPIKLEEIYTTVKVLPKKLIQQFTDLEGIQESFRTRQQYNLDEAENNKQSGIIIANTYKYLTVLGAPGSGKSTLLRKVGLEAIKGTLSYNCIPVFIELKQFTNTQDIDLLKIISQPFKDCDFPNVDNFIKIGLQAGKFIILLDGLDEVPNNTVKKVVTQVREFIKDYKNNRFIISCRTAAYNQQFNNFNDVIIADFDDTQIKQFINNWFCSDVDKRAETAKKCLAALEKKSGAKDLAKTPLLLTFICLVYDQSQTLPKNRSELYNEALKILLEKWAAEKRLERDAIYKDFNTKLEIMLLSEIAYEGFIVDKLFFKTQELVDQIKTFLARNLNAPQDLDGEAVLNAIAIQQGILVERLDNIYSFSHLTLQEYLTAKYIVDNHLIEQTVNKYVTETRWKEVFILIAGLMEGSTGADQLLLYMENKALSYIKSLSDNHRFIKLLEWAETKTKNSPADLTPVAKRVVANANANTYANANANTYANTNANAYAYAYANTYVYTYANANANAYAYAYALKVFIQFIDKIEAAPPLFSGVNLQKLRDQLQLLNTLIPNEKEAREVHRTFAKKLLETWLNAFDLTLDMISLSLKEVKELDQQYFYIYHLILQCKDGAILVTDETWKAIEERMYRVPSS
ncbi:NACHT domain-containing protein [Aphanothece sacrum]|uniref:Two-component sensor histidine kinase n=1 Tax=Aphanothece sacrum FPU1 TaxID=1920663 RepID=A0A401INK9_APHSA|nr:NACHT domain-containing protein [Aphanothece sacrum]GBF82827.1 two-component sensor histidine kinase [Aphanothece sacrum FPU1]GBF85938.1 two-component sensor histidine kinase [Aphanothece sacrum FPU3]